MATSHDFRQASNRILLQVEALYLLIAITVTWAAAGEGFGLVARVLLAVVVVGWCQFALFNALHEGLHQRFGSPHRERLGFALSAWPLGFDRGYRQVHLDHHKYFGDAARDPDYANYANFPATRRQWRRRFLRNLSGWGAISQFFALDSAATAAPPRHWLAVLLTQLVIAALFSLTVGPQYYLLLWLLPLVTVAKLLTSTRTFCEHASPDGEPVIRTITGSFVGEKLLGVFCFHYHAEHHRHVAIPCNQLAAAHRALGPGLAGEASERYEHYPRGYFGLLRAWYRDLPG